MFALCTQTLGSSNIEHPTLYVGHVKSNASPEHHWCCRTTVSTSICLEGQGPTPCGITKAKIA